MIRVLGALALLGSVLPMTTVSAADLSCPLASNEVVAAAVGMPVKGGIMADPLETDKALDTGPYETVCMWDTDDGNMVMVTREQFAFGPNGPTTPTELAIRKARLPQEARDEVDALRENGVSDIRIPNYEFTETGGLGDAAVWMYQHEPTLDVPSGGYIVQRGSDALAFAFIGEVEAISQPRALALAQAILPTLP
jgi:hypothetical protein